jgi:hypothetical protein
MARHDKHLARIAECPKDYEWRELETLMRSLGFEQRSGSGSAYSFRHPTKTDQVIRLHKPHGRNPPTLLIVYVQMVVSRLKDWGYINE